MRSWGGRRAGAERIVITAALALSTAAGLPGVTQSGQTTDAQSPEPTPVFAWYLLYGIVVVLCVRHSRDLLRVAMRSKLVIAVAGWAVLSVFWSDAPGLSHRFVRWTYTHVADRVLVHSEHLSLIHI